MGLKTIVSLAALAICASGCGMKRHYVIDNFDRFYSCEEQFSEDFNSDEITLYESGERAAVRKHKVTVNHEGTPKHEFFYEFYEGDKKIAETFFDNRWTFAEPITDYNVFRKLSLHFYEIKQCEKLLWESKN